VVQSVPQEPAPQPVLTKRTTSSGGSSGWTILAVIFVVVLAVGLIMVRRGALRAFWRPRPRDTRWLPQADGVPEADGSGDGAAAAETMALAGRLTRRSKPKAPQAVVDGDPDAPASPYVRSYLDWLEDR
jgi:hypothetical protein